MRIFFGLPQYCGSKWKGAETLAGDAEGRTVGGQPALNSRVAKGRSGFDTPPKVNNIAKAELVTPAA